MNTKEANKIVTKDKGADMFIGSPLYSPKKHKQAISVLSKKKNKCKKD